jgi:hypothetical protein
MKRVNLPLHPTLFVVNIQVRPHWHVCLEYVLIENAIKTFTMCEYCIK